MNQTDYKPGPLANVEYRVNDGRWTLVFTREFTHSPEKVWEALTNPAHQREWAPFESDRNLSSTGTASFKMIDSDKQMVFDANVTRADAPGLLEYTWGTDLLRWELRATGAGTQLVLRHTTAGKDWLPKVAAGWHICLDVAGYFMDGSPIGRIVGEAAKEHGWIELNDAYAEKLGITSTGWPEDLGRSR
ncbi:MAG: SRPBCC family protein [Arenimonas sp.]